MGERDDKGFHPDLVEKVLGDDEKPVYKGGITLESEAFFKHWYNDDPVNKPIDKTIKLTKNSAGRYVFDKDGYFPIDGEGWGDEISHAGTNHNYYFTLEMHHIFQYQGDEVFTFRGDDDLWVFINDELVIDLGGTHMALSESVDLKTLGLTEGNYYALDLFFAERKKFDSNFRIATTIHLEENIDPDLVGKGDSNQCCLIKALNFLCYPEKQWWTIWC